MDPPRPALPAAAGADSTGMGMVPALSTAPVEAWGEASPLHDSCASTSRLQVAIVLGECALLEESICRWWQCRRQGQAVGGVGWRRVMVQRQLLSASLGRVRHESPARHVLMPTGRKQAGSCWRMVERPAGDGARERRRRRKRRGQSGGSNGGDGGACAPILIVQAHAPPNLPGSRSATPS